MHLPQPLDFPLDPYHALTDTTEQRIAWLRTASDADLAVYVERMRAPTADFARVVNENHGLRLENARLKERGRLYDQLLKTYRQGDPQRREIAVAAAVLRRNGLSGIWRLELALRGYGEGHLTPSPSWRLALRLDALRVRLGALARRFGSRLRRLGRS